MSNRWLDQNRRTFLAAGVAAMSGPSLAFGAGPGAKYRRYNVTSPKGRQMLLSYAKGVKAMIALPASDPRNWFRNAFTHFLDCPHGNWWFYVWHRGYIGYLEQTIRELSGDPEFALPYWDWTALPQIPGGMFDGVLTPTAAEYEPYTSNLAVFTSFIQPALETYWNGLSAGQRSQQAIRGYKAFEEVWNDVTGYSPAQKAGLSGNEAFATTCAARFLSRDNPKLDDKTAYDVSSFVVYAGLLPTDFYNVENDLSFTSSKTASHVTQPDGATKFSVLEGFPHNKVHNYIGGVGPLDPGPYGNMTNFLSPVDPIFFLHHANMDRLWDVWTRKQQRLGLPYLPQGEDLATLSSDPFLFYVGANGQPVGPRKAGDYLSTEVFDYDYEPGFGEAVARPAPRTPATATPGTRFTGAVRDGAAQVELPRTLLQSHLSGALAHPLMADVTFPRPTGSSTAREFDVLVNAPAGVDRVSADSPYYAGTIAFFGPMMPGMAMSSDASFAVPLPRAPQAFSALMAGAGPGDKVSIRLAPSHGPGVPAPAISSLSVRGG